jgi:hypothetical protein
MAKAKANTANGKGESMAGYFRAIFKAQPKLLGERSNEPLLTQWLADHPDHSEVPDAVKASLSNTKSVLRSKKRKKKAVKHAEPVQNGVEMVHVKAPAVKVKGLEALECQIDECLSVARNMDREGLDDVISLLRKARNAVVWKMGQ